jgi:hypothetical protein
MWAERATRTLLDTPAAALADCPPQVSARLGTAVQHTVTLQRNRHTPSATDRRHTLQNDAIAVVVVEVTEHDRCLLEHVDITGPQQLVELPFELGTSRETVIERLGLPARRFSEVDVYDLETAVGADQITLRYSDGVLRSITWDYFID